jgi:hypothetical protein
MTERILITFGLDGAGSEKSGKTQILIVIQSSKRNDFMNKNFMKKMLEESINISNLIISLQAKKMKRKRRKVKVKVKRRIIVVLPKV